MSLRYFSKTLLAVLALSACFGAGRARADSFVGQVAASDAFIAIVAAGDEALAYVCDGSEVAEWLRGTVEDGALELASAAGWTLEGRLTPFGVLGSFTRADGQTLSFSALPASDEAGLYRAERTVDGVGYVGGWIVDQYGEQRGAVIGGGTILTGLVLDLATLQAETQDLGAWNVRRLTAEYLKVAAKP